MLTCVASSKDWLTEMNLRVNGSTAEREREINEMNLFGWASWVRKQGYDIESGDGGAENHQQALGYFQGAVVPHRFRSSVGYY